MNTFLTCAKNCSKDKILCFPSDYPECNDNCFTAAVLHACVELHLKCFHLLLILSTFVCSVNDIHLMLIFCFGRISLITIQQTHQSTAGPKNPFFCVPTDELLQAKDDLLSEGGQSLNSIFADCFGDWFIGIPFVGDDVVAKCISKLH